MLLTEVIVTLREKCPIFERRVQGTQAFVASDAQNADLPVPAAFVVPLYDTAPAMDGTYSQKVTENFAIIIALDNSKDKRDGKGMSTEVALATARKQLNAALVGWTSKLYPSMDQCQYVRGQHLYMNAALYWHQTQWAASYYIQANLAEIDAFVAIQRLVDGYFPDVDPAKIKSIMAVGGVEPVSIFGNPAAYQEVLSVLTGEPIEAWIKRIPGPSEEPGYVSQGQTLQATPPAVAAPNNLKGYDVP